MQERFDALHNKRIRCIGTQFPAAKDFEGICTAALYRYTDDESIIAIMADGYELGMPEKWLRFTLADQYIEQQLADFVVV